MAATRKGPRAHRTASTSTGAGHRVRTAAVFGETAAAPGWPPHSAPLVTVGKKPAASWPLTGLLAVGRETSQACSCRKFIFNLKRNINNQSQPRVLWGHVWGTEKALCLQLQLLLGVGVGWGDSLTRESTLWIIYLISGIAGCPEHPVSSLRQKSEPGPGRRLAASAGALSPTRLSTTWLQTRPAPPPAERPSHAPLLRSMCHAPPLSIYQAPLYAVDCPRGCCRDK